MESQIDRIMRCLKCSREEAEQVIADDKAIDKGERMSFDLSLEDEKQAKKYANVGTRTTKSEKTTKKVVSNPTKEGVISEISAFLSEKGYDSVEITNKTRTIMFKIGEDAYELTLIAKRKAKK